MTSSPASANASFGNHSPSQPHATARHNLATSFTRALSEPKPIAAHQQTPACARELASKRALHPIHNVKQPENRDQRTDVRHLPHQPSSQIRLSQEVTHNSRRLARTWNQARTNCPLPSVLCPLKLVELNGFEPMTPCLQSRCSPS